MRNIAQAVRPWSHRRLQILSVGSEPVGHGASAASRKAGGLWVVGGESGSMNSGVWLLKLGLHACECSSAQLLFLPLRIRLPAYAFQFDLQICLTTKFFYSIRNKKKIKIDA